MFNCHLFLKLICVFLFFFCGKKFHPCKEFFYILDFPPTFSDTPGAISSVVDKIELSIHQNSGQTRALWKDYPNASRLEALKEKLASAKIFMNLQISFNTKLRYSMESLVGGKLSQRTLIYTSQIIFFTEYSAPTYDFTNKYLVCYMWFRSCLYNY